MSAEMERLDKHRSQARTRSGPVSYIDTGGPGRPALFVHGLGTSSYLWRHVIEQLDGQRRCVAVDLPLHGQTPAAADQDFSLPGLAGFIADFCDTLGLTGIDLVANDTGGAISQAFAAGHPERLCTLTLTNCEAHNNLPPKALAPMVLLSRTGLMPASCPGCCYATSRGAASACTAPATRTSPDHAPTTHHLRPAPTGRAADPCPPACESGLPDVEPGDGAADNHAPVLKQAHRERTSPGLLSRPSTTRRRHPGRPPECRTWPRTRRCRPRTGRCRQNLHRPGTIGGSTRPR